MRVGFLVLCFFACNPTRQIEDKPTPDVRISELDLADESPFIRCDYRLEKLRRYLADGTHTAHTGR